jgi:hypothetical protein
MSQLDYPGIGMQIGIGVRIFPAPSGMTLHIQTEEASLQVKLTHEQMYRIMAYWLRQTEVMGMPDYVNQLYETIQQEELHALSTPLD